MRGRNSCSASGQSPMACCPGSTTSGSGSWMTSGFFCGFFRQSQGLAQAPDTKVWEYIDPYEPDSWRVLFFATLMLPSVGGSLITSLHLAKEELKKYEDLLADFDDIFLGTADNVYHHHWLLGYPPQSYSDPELLCQMAHLHITAHDWGPHPPR